jgi:hypothetical protein
MQIERIYHPDMQSQMRAIMLLLRIRLPGEYIVSMPEKETAQDCTSTRPAPTRGASSIAHPVSSLQDSDIHS